jgi:hypothetical protein
LGRVLDPPLAADPKKVRRHSAGKVFGLAGHLEPFLRFLEDSKLDLDFGAVKANESQMSVS